MFGLLLVSERQLIQENLHGLGVLFQTLNELGDFLSCVPLHLLLHLWVDEPVQFRGDLREVGECLEVADCRADYLGEVPLAESTTHVALSVTTLIQEG